MTDPDEAELLEKPRGLSQPRFGPGFLAALPLFLCYEWGVAAAGETMGRNSAELLLTAGLRPFGAHVDVVRWVVLAVLCVVVGWRMLPIEGERVWRSFLRTLAEGLVFAVVLGPILIGLVSLLDVSPLATGFGADGLPPNPNLAQVARVGGAAIWEELLYRVGFYSICYLFIVRLAAFFGTVGTTWHLLADLVAILGSSLVFAALHLQSITSPLGVGGEPFDAAVFVWRLFAGILLAGLYRWRGLGVVAWAHGLFNLALFLGADPLVFGAG